MGKMRFGLVEENVITKEDFISKENSMDRPYPKRFKIAVPSNMYCGKKQK